MPALGVVVAFGDAAAAPAPAAAPGVPALVANVAGEGELERSERVAFRGVDVEGAALVLLDAGVALLVGVFAGVLLADVLLADVLFTGVFLAGVLLAGEPATGASGAGAL